MRHLPRTSVSYLCGTAPNRIFNIEWRALFISPRSSNANFELRLYEGQSSRFDVIYGAVSGGANSATAGVQRDDTCFTEYLLQRRRWAQLPATDRGPAGTPSPTPTPTATATAATSATATATATCYCYAYGHSYSHSHAD